ncbi:MAG: hypothetical protein EOO16_07365 [Chitinophagaceae bacterium]|nr:MAG: hypothetical protein EOO16_07365 [Chitinophagaceae bacterium]
MTEYNATARQYTRFEVTQGDTLIGSLTYGSWYQMSAGIEMAGGTSYRVEPKGFWGTTLELKAGEAVLLKFRMNWKGEIVIQPGEGPEKGFLLKHRGFFKESFVLLDPDEAELLVLKPEIKWSRFSYEYRLTAADSFEALRDKDLLLLVSVHCANYYIWMMSAAG